MDDIISNKSGALDLNPRSISPLRSKPNIERPFKQLKIVVWKIRVSIWIRTKLRIELIMKITERRFELRLSSFLEEMTWLVIIYWNLYLIGRFSIYKIQYIVSKGLEFLCGADGTVGLDGISPRFRPPKDSMPFPLELGFQRTLPLKPVWALWWPCFPSRASRAHQPSFKERPERLTWTTDKRHKDLVAMRGLQTNTPRCKTCLQKTLYFSLSVAASMLRRSSLQWQALLRV